MLQSDHVCVPVVLEEKYICLGTRVKQMLDRGVNKQKYSVPIDYKIHEIYKKSASLMAK